MNRKQRRTEQGRGTSGNADPALQGLFAEAFRHHQAGRLAEAEPLYRQILTLDPRHADSLHLLGVLANQVGRHDVAADLIGQAIAARGDVPAFHNNLANALKAQGRLDEAAASYRRALALKSDYADALNNLGVILKSQGKLEEAAAYYERARKIAPGSAEIHSNLGNVLQSLGRHDDAEACFMRAIAIKPDYAEAHYNLGNALNAQSKFDEAAACHERAIALKPDYAEAYYNLGNILKGQGKLEGAVVYFRQAIAFNQNYVEAHIHLGNVLQDLGRFGDAEAQYLLAAVLKPDSPDIFNNLAIVLMAQNKFDESIVCFERTLALKPDYAAAYYNMAGPLQRMGMMDEAMACFEKAIALSPDSAAALNNIGTGIKDHGMLDDAIGYFRRALALDPESDAIYSNLLLTMVYAASVSPQELTDESLKFGRRLADPLLRARPMIRDADLERKLRIGYVSPDFRDHAVNYFFEFLLDIHDRQRFDIFAYSNNLADDFVTARLKQKSDHWRHIRFMSDDKAADLIEADKIDVLVDLAGHTGYNRLMVFARKPAPVQVTWLGHPATTGMKAMDYRLTDSYAEPEGMTEHLNAETLWRLPEIFCCYTAHENSPAVIDHPPFEDNGTITFGCFNNFSKVTDPVLETWAKILERVPDSRLLLEIRGIESPQFRMSVEDRLRRLGLPLDRVILEPRKKSNQFVLYNRLDVALDPFPCVGGTTSFDALWMGVPFVTLAGGHFGSRMGVTILTNAGIPELIAENREKYIDLAVDLARDKDRLRGLRHNLRDRAAASPLMDQKKFTRNMEEAYRGMWRKWCEHES